MCSRISIRGCVRPSVGRSVGHTRVEILQKCRFRPKLLAVPTRTHLMLCIRPCYLHQQAFFYSSHLPPWCNHFRIGRKMLDFSCFRFELASAELNDDPVPSKTTLLACGDGCINEILSGSSATFPPFYSSLWRYPGFGWSFISSWPKFFTRPLPLWWDWRAVGSLTYISPFPPSSTLPW